MSAGAHIVLDSPSWIQQVERGLGKNPQVWISVAKPVGAWGLCSSFHISFFLPFLKRVKVESRNLEVEFYCKLGETSADSVSQGLNAALFKGPKGHSCSHPSYAALAPRADVRLSCCGRKGAMCPPLPFHLKVLVNMYTYSPVAPSKWWFPFTFHLNI